VKAVPIKGSSFLEEISPCISSSRAIDEKRKSDILQLDIMSCNLELYQVRGSIFRGAKVYGLRTTGFVANPLRKA